MQSVNNKETQLMSHINTQPGISEAWKGAMKNTYFRWQFIISAALIYSFTLIFLHFFDFIEARTGTQLNDYLLQVLPAIDVSWAIFFILYSSIVVGLIAHLAHPKAILLIMQTYVLITFVRIGVITLFPLEPPFDYLPLREPVIQFFTNGGKIISKDLFFSGHVSTIMSIYLGSHLPRTKKYLFACVWLMSLLLMVQHVHYTIDVLAAIPATWLVFKFCKKYLGGKSFDN